MVPFRPTPAAEAVAGNAALLGQFLNCDAAAAELEARLTRGPAIRPFFDEYARACLQPARARGAAAAAVDFHALVEWSRFRNVFNKAAFTQPAPALGAPPARWTPLDHAARFVVRVLRYSWHHAADDPAAFWSAGACDLAAVADDPDADLEFWQAWLVLRYLQAAWEKAHPPKCVGVL